ncbi:MAG: transporter substrate-binding domain-containing protein [Treponema sp.]|nr:transporter substrate-binding domain-containing protein [Treponema sp.]
MKKSACTALCSVLAAAMLLAATGCSKKEKVIINSAADLNGKKIGCQAGTTGEMYIQENIPNADVKSFKTGIDASLALKNGSIDAIVLDELPAQQIVKRNPDLVIVNDKFATEEYAIAVRKGDSQLLSSINATISAMKSDGRYEALVNAFMPIDGNIVVPSEILTEGSKTVKMGTNASFPPFEYTEGADPIGFDITMSQYIAKDYGAKLQVVDMNFDGLIAALQSGAIDFIAAGMTATDERRKNVDFSDPYFVSNQVIIIHK